MTDSEALTAVLLQLSGITEQLSDLGRRQAGDAGEIRDQIASLTTMLNGLRSTVAEHDDALAAVESLDKQLTELAARLDEANAPGDDPAGYQPSASPRMWKLDGAERDAAIAKLRAWVEQVYRPGYGHLSASLADCWDQHPLCLYVLDWLSELWSVLYLQPKRTAGTLAGQAEWHTRLLTAAADQLAQETRRCGHATRQRSADWTGTRP